VRVRLSEKQKIILGLVELQGDLTIQDIARVSGYKQTTIQYALSSLKDRKVMYHRQAMIDLHRLGYSHHTVFFSVAAKQDADTVSLVQKVAALPHVFWLFEMAGRYQFAVSISIRCAAHLPQFIDLLGRTLGGSLVEIAACSQFEFRYFGRRYLLPKRFKTPILEFNVQEEVSTLDKASERVLSLLATGEAQTAVQLSKALGIPPATADRRRRELKENGIIKAYIHWIDPTKLGRTCYIFRVNVRGVPSKFSQRLFSYLESERDVLFGLRCVGPWDYEIGVELESAQDVSELANRLYQKFREEILSVQPIPILRYLLVRGYPRGALA